MWYKCLSFEYILRSIAKIVDTFSQVIINECIQSSIGVRYHKNTKNVFLDTLYNLVCKEFASNAEREMEALRLN